MSDLPEPLTPADCDLRGLKFMPLDVQQVRDSSLTAKASGDAFRAAVILWCAAWQQIPAASLPDDDEELAHLCGYGRALKEWKKIRQWALHKFVKCSDGRLYHPLIAEKAIEAHGRRGEWSEKQDTKTERQRRWRERQKELSEKLRAAGKTPPKGASLETLEEMLRDAGVDAHVDNGVDAQASTRPSTVDAGEVPKTGTGTGTIPPTPTTPPPTSYQSMCQQVADEAGMLGVPPDHRHLREWLALPDMEFERDILPVVRRVASEVKAKGGQTPFKFKLFDAAIREQQAKDAAEIARYRRITAEYSQPPEAAH